MKQNPQLADSPNQRRMLHALTRLGTALGVSVDRSDVAAAVESENAQESTTLLQRSARQSGIFLRETQFGSAHDAIEMVREGFPILLISAEGTYVVVEITGGSNVEATVIADQISTQPVSARQLQNLLSPELHPHSFVAKRELECDSISGAPGHQTAAHDHPTPLRRFLGLLSLDQRDVWTVILFAFISGLLSLATPLAVESLVNVVSWGIYLQPLIVLGLMLLTCLGFAGVLNVLQAVVVEMMQRRQFVRIVSDLAHRFPRANQESLVGKFPRELANRVFDIMTIQKATAILLLDGVSIVLATMIGLLLLAFYHPFLLGFDIALLLAMTSITWALGRGGIQTAIQESVTKYAVAHWLQDVLSSPTVFKTGGGEELAVARANQLTTNYINARRKQFHVVLRQIIFAVGLQVIASTALLALGGWLVIDGQLTLGQLVASELVVTVVVGAFAKAGKSLEKFYDLMAGMDKVGYLLDIPIDSISDQVPDSDGAADVSWSDLVFNLPTHQHRIAAGSIGSGTKVAITGDDLDGGSLFAKALAGLVEPNNGLVRVAGLDSAQAAITNTGALSGYVGNPEVFHGTVRQNIDLSRMGICQSRIREINAAVGLSSTIVKLPDGLDTHLLTGGHPLSRIPLIQLMFARVMVAGPKLLVVDRVLDELDSNTQMNVWNALSDNGADWTLVVVTNNDDIAKRCDSQIYIRRSGGQTI